MIKVNSSFIKVKCLISVYRN